MLRAGKGLLQVAQDELVPLVLELNRAVLVPLSALWIGTVAERDCIAKRVSRLSGPRA